MAYRYKPRYNRHRNYDFEDGDDERRNNGGGGYGGRRRGGQYRSRSDYFMSSSFGGGFRPHNRDGPDDGWFRAVVPGANEEELSKSQLCSMLNDRSNIPITVFHFFSDRTNNRIVFFVNSRSEAQEIKNVSRRLTINSRSVSIYVSRVTEPSFMFGSEMLDVVRRWMSGRYSSETGILALGGMSRNEALRADGIYMNLGRPACLSIVMGICEELFPNTTILDLRENNITSLDAMRNRLPHVSRLNLEQNRIHRLRELDYISHMQLIELSIEQNPLCRQFENIDDLTNAIRDKCPKLNILNGNQLAPRIGFAIDDEPVVLPPPIPHSVPEELRDVISQFVNEYFTYFDAGREERQPLMNIYSDDASLSFSVNCGSRAFKFDRYVKEGRNFIRVIDDASRCDRLKQGRFDIVSFLTKFPQTKHDVDSFKVDVFAFAPDRMSFSISGLLVEDTSELSNDDKPTQIRQFFRVFHCVFVDASRTNFKIQFEHFTISDPTIQQVKSAQLLASTVIGRPKSVETQWFSAFLLSNHHCCLIIRRQQKTNVAQLPLPLIKRFLCSCC